jgi:hypothetical protein
MTARPGGRGPDAFPLEVAVAWGMFAAVAGAILVTYARLPAGDLYHVSGTGPVAGASRALVFGNFPLALVAIAILAILADRLRSRAVAATAVVGAILCAAVYWPGVVKESNLDARPVNALAAVGVLVALAVTVLAFVRLPARSRLLSRQRGDGGRIVVAVATLVLAVPWGAAEIGVHFDGVPILGTLYQTGELRSQPGVAGLHPAVHFGHHHGMDGALLILSALLLSRTLGTIGARWLRLGLGAYLALMLCYGAGNVANDFWTEQVVKRGWTTWALPSVTTPTAGVAWAVVLVAAALVFVAGRREGREPRQGGVEVGTDRP